MLLGIELDANSSEYDELMDIYMPQMNGEEAAKSIRAMDVPFASSIPIIAMTANVFKEDVENYRAVGMNDHIGKPININEVIFKLQFSLYYSAKIKLCNMHNFSRIASAKSQVLCDLCA